MRQIQNKAMEKIRLQLEAHFLGNRQALEEQQAVLEQGGDIKTPGNVAARMAASMLEHMGSLN